MEVRSGPGSGPPLKPEGFVPIPGLPDSEPAPPPMPVRAPSAFDEVPQATSAERSAAIEATGRIVAAWLTRHNYSLSSAEVEEKIGHFKTALLK